MRQPAIRVGLERRRICDGYQVSFCSYTSSGGALGVPVVLQNALGNERKDFKAAKETIIETLGRYNIKREDIQVTCGF